MSRYTIIAVHETGLPVNITFRLWPGAPQTRYQPADPTEIEYISCDDPAFDSWAEAWLADHEEEAIELAEEEGP